MKSHLFALFAFVAIALLLAAQPCSAAPTVFAEADLASGNPISSGGTTLTTTASSGGSISFFPSGPYTGLWLGQSDTSGDYSFSFSQPATSIAIEFEALSSTGTGAPETLFNFATDLGPISIGYINQFGTTFNGTTITSTASDGQGIITFEGPAFNSLSFQHIQGIQSGFIIERVVLNGPIPEPASISLLSLGIGILGCATKRHVRAPLRHIVPNRERA